MNIAVMLAEADRLESEAVAALDVATADAQANGRLDPRCSLLRCPASEALYAQARALRNEVSEIHAETHPVVAVSAGPPASATPLAPARGVPNAALQAAVDAAVVSALTPSKASAEIDAPVAGVASFIPRTASRPRELSRQEQVEAAVRRIVGEDDYVAPAEAAAAEHGYPETFEVDAVVARILNCDAATASGDERQDAVVARILAA